MEFDALFRYHIHLIKFIVQLPHLSCSIANSLALGLLGVVQVLFSGSFFTAHEHYRWSSWALDGLERRCESCFGLLW